MKTRVDDLAENQLVARLMRVRQDFDDLKTNQAFGSTSVRLVEVASSAASDYTCSASYGVINAFDITFTPAGYLIPNTGFVWQLFLTATVTGTGSYISATENAQIDPGTGKWVTRVYYTALSPGDLPIIKVQVKLYAMSKGTISVVQIY